MGAYYTEKLKGKANRGTIQDRNKPPGQGVRTLEISAPKVALRRMQLESMEEVEQSEKPLDLGT